MLATEHGICQLDSILICENGFASCQTFKTFIFRAIINLKIKKKITDYAFEKVTDYDFVGTVYYTEKNVSLTECRNWCSGEKSCKALSFNFISNPLVPNHDTECRLFNDTSASDPNTVAHRSINSYFLLKLQINSNRVCKRPWTFERVPNKMIRELDNALIYTSSKEACLSACLNEVIFAGFFK